MDCSGTKTSVRGRTSAVLAVLAGEATTEAGGVGAGEADIRETSPDGPEGARVIWFMGILGALGAGRLRERRGQVSWRQLEWKGVEYTFFAQSSA